MAANRGVVSLGNHMGVMEQTLCPSGKRLA